MENELNAAINGSEKHGKIQAGLQDIRRAYSFMDQMEDAMADVAERNM